MRKGDATTHTVQFDAATGALPCRFSASVANLTVKESARVASFAIKSSTTDQTTRIFRSARSVGQIYGQRWTSVPSRLACSTALPEEGWASSGSGDESGWAINRGPEELRLKNRIGPGEWRSRVLPFSSVIVPFL